MDGNVIINPLQLPTSGVNTTTNTFTIEDHALETGFKVLAYGTNGVGSSLPSGLEQRTYFVLKVDNDNFQLADSKVQLFKDPPEIVSVASTGFVGQTINPINPPIKVTRNNNIVFDLNHTSLSGSELKIFYDNNYFNEFVGSGTTANLEVVGFGTVGIGTTSYLLLRLRQLITISLLAANCIMVLKKVDICPPQTQRLLDTTKSLL